jgi:probable phosphoglycerate mutase
VKGRRLVLWRHGRTEWNATRRFQGQADTPLDEVGHAQAERAAKLLCELEPSKLAASDLQRAHATAKYLSSMTGLEIQTHAGLRETGAGTWEGLYQHELIAKYPNELRAWVLGEDVVPGETGEKRTVVAARMRAAIDELLADVPENGVLVVTTHGGAARAVTGSLLELPIKFWASFGGLANAAWTVLSEPNSRFAPPGAWDSNTFSKNVDDSANAETPSDQLKGAERKSGPWRLIEYNAGSLPEPVIGDDR